MNCQNLPIADFVDGELDPAGEHAVERHLEECGRCRALVADVRTVRAAAFTLDRREPPAHLLARLQERLASEPPMAPARLPSPGAWTVWLAAAAVLVLATVAGLLPVLGGGRADRTTDTLVESPAGVPLVDSVESDLRLAEAHYDKAIQGLEQIARGDTDELDPQLAAVLQKNLQVVDRAIDESRAALKTQPGSPTAQDGLFDAMRAKVSLLQQTVELINEMRKGNQAEAGRLMQDLSR